jgi:hypothetical protein
MSRFLNVVSLFNDTIPLIALQKQALRVGDNATLVFTTVMDELTRGVVDEDEDAEAAPTDRAYWEQKIGAKDTVAMADQSLEITGPFDPTLESKYNKFYIGLARNGQPFNFVTFRPRKAQMTLELKLKPSDEIDAKIDGAGIDALEYNKHWGVYRIRLGRGDVKKYSEVLQELIGLAYEYRNG